MPDNLYKEYRQNLKDRYNSEGSRYMSDEVLLELMLFYSTPNKCDTRAIVQSLIENFGSFAGVLEASYDELKNIKDVNENIATYLTLYISAIKRYKERKVNLNFNISDHKAIEEYLRSKYINITGERAMLLHFNEDGSFITSTWIGEGLIDRVSLDFKAITSKVIQNQSKKVIFVHNHPSGFPTPSIDDKRALTELSKLFKMIEVELADNIILTNKSILFFSDHKQYDKFYR